MNLTSKTAACAIALLSLSACGGGGGGGVQPVTGSTGASAPAQNTAQNTSQDTTTQTPLPQAQVTGIDVNGDPNAEQGQFATNVTLYPTAQPSPAGRPLADGATATDNGDGTFTQTFSAAAFPAPNKVDQGATVTVTTGADGFVTSVQVASADYSHTFSGPFNGFELDNSNFPPLMVRHDGAAVGNLSEHNLIIREPGTMSFASYGAWSQLDPTTGNVIAMGAGIWGQPTNAADMPRTGTAEYNVAGGGYLNNGTTAVSLVGTGRYVADFASQSVAGHLAMMTSVAGPTGPTSSNWGYVDSTARITGSSFGGTATFTPVAGVTTPGMTGTTAGAFFGNTANPAVEIAGSANLAGGGQSAVIGFGGGKK